MILRAFLYLIVLSVCPLIAVKESELLASVRERYTTVKRLVVTAAKLALQDDFSSSTARRDVLVEVQFTGPQPSEGPGALLCDLLCGVSVDARPVELPRGRKKRARTGAASSEASDSGKLLLQLRMHANIAGILYRMDTQSVMVVNVRVLWYALRRAAVFM